MVDYLKSLSVIAPVSRLAKRQAKAILYMIALDSEFTSTPPRKVAVAALTISMISLGEDTSVSSLWSASGFTDPKTLEQVFNFLLNFEGQFPGMDHAMSFLEFEMHVKKGKVHFYFPDEEESYESAESKLAS
jgi:hypothetical protein